MKLIKIAESLFLLMLFISTPLISPDLDENVKNRELYNEITFQLLSNDRTLKLTGGKQ